jgi:hypothetical protein
MKESFATTSVAPVVALPEKTTQNRAATPKGPLDTIAFAVTELCSVKKIDANRKVPTSGDG